MTIKEAERQLRAANDAPTLRSGKGWVNAGAESMLAMLCNTLARRECLRPEAIWQWCKAVGYNYDSLSTYRPSVIRSCLMIAIYNGWTIEETLKRLS